MKVLDGRVALVTAAGSGMGRAASLKLASSGATVIAASRSRDGIDETVALIEASGGKAEAYQVDVTDVSQIGRMFSHVDARYGRLNVLFNHFGTPGPGGINLTEEQFHDAVDTNLKGSFFCTSYAEPLLRREPGRASIIFTSSVSGLIGSLFSPVYSMVKTGLVGLTRALALSLAPDIRVNVICPGAVDTPMLEQFFGRDPSVDAQALVARFVETSVPLGRVATAEEVAELVHFLASDASSFITGTAIPIEGGYTAR